MIEMIFSILGALVIFVFAALRLNQLHAFRNRLTLYQALEVLGAALTMAGCMGIAGEWFLPGLEVMRAETLLVAGIAIFIIGACEGGPETAIARFQGWDGKDRRGCT